MSDPALWAYAVCDNPILADRVSVFCGQKHTAGHLEEGHRDVQWLSHAIRDCVEGSCLFVWRPCDVALLVSPQLIHTVEAQLLFWINFVHESAPHTHKVINCFLSF